MAQHRRAGISVALLLSGGVLDAVADDGLRKKTQAAAQPRSLFGDPCGPLAVLPGTPTIPDGYLFGFTDPTDPGAVCAWDFASENDFRWNRRDGRAFALARKDEFSYGAARNIALSFAIFTAYTKWSDVTIMRDTLTDAGAAIGGIDQRAADGFSSEFFVRLLSRSPGQPLAVAFAIEPRWFRLDAQNNTGHPITGGGVTFYLATDAVITDRLFAAFNVNYLVATQKYVMDNAGWARLSTLSVSGSVAAQIYAANGWFIQGLFLGGEARYRANFSGLTFDRAVGAAVNAGPTFTITFPGERNINLSWNPQVYGRARPASAPGALDLDNFDRQELRLKFAAPIYTPP